MAKEYIVPSDVHEVTNYNHAVKAGNTIYVAGQVPFDVDGNLVGEGDVYVQTEQVLKNIERVLAAAGANLKDIVKLNVYLRQGADSARHREARNKILPRPLPAITLAEIVALAQPGWLVEIEAVAAVD